LKHNLTLINGNIITNNPKTPRAKTVVIQNRHIFSVDSNKGIGSHFEGTKVINLNGKTVLPGFIDSHVHLTSTGIKEFAIDFSSTKSISDVQAVIRQSVLDTRIDRILFGMSINNFSFPNRQLPTQSDLDAVSSDHPVFILGRTEHYALINTRCIEEFGLSNLDSACFSEGVLIGRPLVNAYLKIRSQIIKEIGLIEIQNKAAQRAIQVGLTTVHALEGSDQANDPEVLSLMSIAQSLPIRIILWYQTLNVDYVKELGLNRIGGCILLDGDFSPHTAALLEPYYDQPNNFGTLYYSQEELNKFVERAHQAGLQIAMHAVGDRSAEQALNAYAAAIKNFPNNKHRHRIEHFEIYNDRLVKQAKFLDVCLAIHAVTRWSCSAC